MPDPKALVRAACSGCGVRLAAPLSLAGKSVKCRKCGGMVTFPEAELLLDDPPPVSAPQAPTAPSAAQAPPAAARPRPVKTETWRVALQWCFAVSLLPLLFSFGRHEDDSGDRLFSVLQDHPEIVSQVEKGQITSASDLFDKILATLPGNKLEGAYLPRDSKTHWFLAFVVAALFYGYFFAAFPRGEAKEQHLGLVALFTATVGIFLLLAFQYAAACTQTVWIRGTGVVAILFYVVKFIGFSYSCAEDPSNGFVASLFGFTLGVGLCEELTKALPVIWHFRKHATLDWRGSVVWGPDERGGVRGERGDSLLRRAL